MATSIRAGLHVTVATQMTAMVESPQWGLWQTRPERGLRRGSMASDAAGVVNPNYGRSGVLTAFAEALEAGIVARPSGLHGLQGTSKTRDSSQRVLLPARSALGKPDLREAALLGSHARNENA